MKPSYTSLEDVRAATIRKQLREDSETRENLSPIQKAARKELFFLFSRKQWASDLNAVRFLFEENDDEPQTKNGDFRAYNWAKVYNRSEELKLMTGVDSFSIRDLVEIFPDVVNQQFICSSYEDQVNQESFPRRNLTTFQLAINSGTINDVVFLAENAKIEALESDSGISSLIKFSKTANKPHVVKYLESRLVDFRRTHQLNPSAPSEDLKEDESSITEEVKEKEIPEAIAVDDSAVEAVDASLIVEDVKIKKVHYPQHNWTNQIDAKLDSLNPEKRKEVLNQLLMDALSQDNQKAVLCEKVRISRNSFEEPKFTSYGVSKLLEMGADPNPSGLTPLQKLSQRMTSSLDSKVNWSSETKITENEVRKNHLKSLEALLKAGADLNKINWDVVITQKREDEFCSFDPNKDNIAALSYLLALGANPNDKSAKSTSTPLGQALEELNKFHTKNKSKDSDVIDRKKSLLEYCTSLIEAGCQLDANRNLDFVKSLNKEDMALLVRTAIRSGQDVDATKVNVSFTTTDRLSLGLVKGPSTKLREIVKEEKEQFNNLKNYLKTDLRQNRKSSVKEEISKGVSSSAGVEYKSGPEEEKLASKNKLFTSDQIKAAEKTDQQTIPKKKNFIKSAGKYVARALKSLQSPSKNNPHAVAPSAPPEEVILPSAPPEEVILPSAPVVDTTVLSDTSESLISNQLRSAEKTDSAITSSTSSHQERKGFIKSGIKSVGNALNSLRGSSKIHYDSDAVTKEASAPPLEYPPANRVAYPEVPTNPISGNNIPSTSMQTTAESSPPLNLLKQSQKLTTPLR